MSEPRKTRGSRLRYPALAAFVGALLVLGWLDHRSVERGNRLFRDGDVATAEAIYRDAAAEGPRGAAGYNLGTALLVEGSAEADSYLEAAAASDDSLLAQRSSYNLGYAHLVRIEPGMAPDSAIPVLTAAVARSRTALRMNPSDENARWNLALGQRMLDSLTFDYRVVDRESEAGEDEMNLEDQARTRSSEGDGVSGIEPEDPSPAENLGQRTGAATGAREAWATQDPGPISAEAALQLISSRDDDAEQLVRGLLWAHRPDVAWWNSEPYPGGDW